MRGVVKYVVAVVSLAFATNAFAQASLTGTVRDTSGAVLPGVTVEATSPALIEKVRTAVTDGSGQFRIVDLRSGSYTLTFSLPGFATVRREDIAVSGDATLTVNAELRVGGLEETITVTGESPIVDVQSVRRQVVVEGDTLKDLPIARAYGTLFQLNPTASVGQNMAARDVQVAPSMFVFGGPGGRNNEGRLQVDGLNVGAALNGGGVSSYVADVGNAQEVAMTTSGGLGEAEVGGPQINIIPRSGGNTFQGSLFVASVRDWMVGDNLSQDLIDRGLGRAGDIIKLWDHNLGLGGPIVRDRLWYFGTIRDEGLYRSVPNMWANANAGDPNARTYVPDLSRPAVQAGSWTIYNLRLTTQATSKNRFSVYWDEQKPCEGGAYTPDAEACRTPDGQLTINGEKTNYVIAGAAGASSGATGSNFAPETSTYRGRHANGAGEYQRVQQARWTSTATNKLLLEAGLGTYMSRWGGHDAPGNPTKDLVRVVEQCPVSTGCAANFNLAGLNYRSANWATNVMKNINWNTSASYVTGAHSMKFGWIAHYHLTNGENFTNSQNLQYRVANGVPNQLTQNLTGSYIVKNRTQQDSFYGQEQWTMGRWTLQGALRFDYARSHFPEQVINPTRFLPSGAVIPSETGVRGFTDLSPRAGAAWDVFGNGRTAVKLNVGKYLEAATNQNLYTATNPISRLSSSVFRTWTDANDNFVPDCNLLDLRANDARAAGGDFCGQVNNLNFGQVQAANTTYDEDLLGGWGVRPADWQIGASVQQEVLPRISVEVGYTRRWLTNFDETDNLAVSAADFDVFSLTAPSDPRLPNGGGQEITRLFNVDPGLFGRTQNFVTRASTFGERRQMYNGVLFNVSARPRNGLTAQAGVNVGKTAQDSCEIRAALPETDPLDPYCEWDTGWEPRVTGLASYLVPVVDVSIAATFRSDRGQQLAANRAFSRAEVTAALGRPPAGTAPTLTVNLIEPGTLYGDRINNIDMRFAKILRFGRTRTNVGVDVYNILNQNPVLSYNQTFGPTWLRPQSILAARFVKFSAQVDF